MERKKLIRPITVLKVKNYMQEVFDRVSKGENFSLDALAREHSISGSNGTALVTEGWIMASDVKGTYLFPEKYEFAFLLVTDNDAKRLIEQVRTKKYKSDITEKSSRLNIGSQEGPEITINLKNDQEHVLQKKSVKSAEFAPILEKIFSKINEGKQSDLFDGINNIHNERIHVASAISSGVWASLGLGQDFPRLSEEYIREINRKIAFTTDDLMDQILNFKKSNK